MAKTVKVSKARLIKAITKQRDEVIARNKEFEVKKAKQEAADAEARTKALLTYGKELAKYTAKFVKDCDAAVQAFAEGKADLNYVGRIVLPLFSPPVFQPPEPKYKFYQLESLTYWNQALKKLDLIEGEYIDLRDHDEYLRLI